MSISPISQQSPLAAMANLPQQHSYLDKVLEPYLRALSSEERDAPNSLTVANSYNNIGCVYREKGDSDKALEQYQRALTIQEVDVPNSLTVATTYINIGLVYADKGDLDKALEYHQRALTIRDRDAQHALAVAASHNSIGHTYCIGDGIRKLEEILLSYDHMSSNTSSTPTQVTSPQHMTFCNKVPLLRWPICLSNIVISTRTWSVICVPCLLKSAMHPIPRQWQIPTTILEA